MESKDREKLPRLVPIASIPYKTRPKIKWHHPRAIRRPHQPGNFPAGTVGSFRCCRVVPSLQRDERSRNDVQR